MIGNGIGNGIGADETDAPQIETLGQRADALIAEYTAMGNPLTNMSLAAKLTGRAFELIGEMAHREDALINAVAAMADAVSRQAISLENFDRAARTKLDELEALIKSLPTPTELDEVFASLRADIEALTPYKDEDAGGDPGGA